MYTHVHMYIYIYIYTQLRPGLHLLARLLPAEGHYDNSNNLNDNNNDDSNGNNHCVAMIRIITMISLTTII